MSHALAEAPGRVARPIHWQRYESPIALGLIAALVWLAQFHHFRDFGLYEDDYWFISEAMGKNVDYLQRRFVTAFTTLPQGRPLGFFLPDLLSFVGDKLGGLAGIYLVGFAVVTLNTFLCYRLLRTRVPIAAAVVGAGVFCLFPSDTTKILLTHDFQLQPSLTFALLSGLAYASGRRPLAYVVSVGALLSYENGFLALFALPLFTTRCWDRRLVRELIQHVLILLGIVAAVVVVRYFVGEGRATSSLGNVGAILPLFASSLVLGPARSLAGMLYGPLKAVPTWNLETIAAAALGFLGFFVVLWRVPRPKAEVRQAVQVAIAGAVMLVIGYALAFTHYPPNALVGRGTSVHLGATLGMSVLATGLAWLVLGWRPRLAIALISGYLALAVGYYVTIERDFVRSWQLQREFWQQVQACCSDLQDGTVLLYTLSSAEEPTFIFTNSWADPLILGETFAFPTTWSQPPRLFSLTEWQNRVQADGDQLEWWVPAASWDEHWEPLPQDNVILLTRAADGTLTRATGTIEVPGGTLTLKPPSAPESWPAAQLDAPLLDQ
ncbi:MAG: hypothetical protein JO057_11755 [Chloroflexi bacterium]|nr:hypothetical protein [Chloroflexota bacterium]